MTTKDPKRKQLGAEKMARIPIKIEKSTKRLPKPPWIRVKIPATNSINALKTKIRDKK